MVFNFDSKNFIGQSAINNKPSKNDKNLDEVADITIQDAGLINIFNLRGSQRSSIFRQVIQSSLDVQIPNKTGTFTTNDKKFILQTSPDEWVILSETKDINIKSLELEKKLTKVNYSLINLTDQYQVVYIFGEKI
jgi:sarcosine oxidase gamma subunit